MIRVLVDSSVWIAFFKGKEDSLPMMELIDSNRICINSLILSELVPSLSLRKESHLVDLLRSVERLEMNIDWDNIITMQTLNLQKGFNKVGIPDLIIAQNAFQNKAVLYTLDRHFELMEPHHQFKIFRR